MMIPKYTTLKKWTESLIIDFPNDNVPINFNEDNWKVLGNSLARENTFADNGCPGTKSFHDWNSWAYAVFKSMANF